ncbi:MAG: hypothetical protein GXP25_02555 [Planctomycetes bacterium]|nr:hypothetical protein [Planctomycetota bacterium]
MVLKRGTSFTGEVIREDDKKIRIKTGGAEIEWEKKWVKEILRYTKRPAMKLDISEDSTPKTSERRTVPDVEEPKPGPRPTPRGGTVEIFLVVKSPEGVNPGPDFAEARSRATAKARPSKCPKARWPMPTAS